MRRTRAVQPGGELIEIGLADGDRTRIDQALHHRRMLLRLIGKLGTARRGRRTGQIDVVLDGERNAVQRQLQRVFVLQGRNIFFYLFQRQAIDPDVMRIVADAGDDVPHHVARMNFACQITPGAVK